MTTYDNTVIVKTGRWLMRWPADLTLGRFAAASRYVNPAAMFVWNTAERRIEYVNSSRRGALPKIRGES